MGILRLALGEGTTMMKLLISACLVALALADAEPKADADPYYGYYGLGYHGLGYGLRAYGYGSPYAYGHYGYYGKRSADAEPTAVAEAKPEADPYYGYYGLGYHGYGYGLRAYGYGYPYAYGHYGYYGKRSAVAEPAAAPEAEAAADPYYGYYGLGYHGLGYRAYGGYYGHGLGYYGYGHGLYGYYG